MTIDDALAKLEEITHKLEADEIGLEEAISLFDEGLQLASLVREKLEAAKLKVEQVLERTKGTFSLESLDLP